ncbi:MFS general substrate transporter [Phlegmacium glaucopus]|nr:MFS general substrate transporter [Phlegmacium glaucopus]
MTAMSVPLMTTARITSLAASFIVALGSGTNYVFSAYSPQLGARLKMSHTQLNFVGSAGNAGVYSSGLVWGSIVDSYGPRILLSCSFIFLLGGYSGIRYFYDSGPPPEARTLPNLGFGILIFCSFITGCGGGGGLASTVNSVAKSFPDRARGSATGLVASAFGLSAFFFSSISNVYFANDPSAFLLLLSLGTSLPMIMGFFLVRPIPLLDEGVWRNYQVSNNSRTRLLDSDFIEGENSHATYTVPNVATAYTIRDVSENDIYQVSRPSAVSDSLLLRNLENRTVLQSGDFWLLFTILSLLSGTGMLFMNNVGSMSQFLYAHKNSNYDDAEASRWQASQVSTISLMNFLGRIFIGLISDFVKNKYDTPRSYSITLVASILLVSQIVAANVRDISHLWMASSLLGLAHGCAFSLFPTVCLEWFGISTFSENWGYLGASPMAAGNLFSFIFGRNVDAHNDSRFFTVPLITVMDSMPNCLEGLDCYVGGIYFTIGTTVLAVLLSIWAGYKDRQRKYLGLAHPTRKRTGVDHSVDHNGER